MKRHVCTDCGHIEIRSIAPMNCPNCDSDYVVDDSEMENQELDEEDVRLLIAQVVKEEA